jgi:hypothetical protein
LTQARRSRCVPEDDSKKSTDELLEEYSRIVALTLRDAENALRVRTIMAELQRRGAIGKPKPNTHLRSRARSRTKPRKSSCEPTSA